MSLASKSLRCGKVLEGSLVIRELKVTFISLCAKGIKSQRRTRRLKL
jgi:hypothetical protein